MCKLQWPTCVYAGVPRALGAQLCAIHLPDAAAGNRDALKLVKQVLHRGIKRALYRVPRELQPMRWRLLERHSAVRK